MYLVSAELYLVSAILYLVSADLYLVSADLYLVSAELFLVSADFYASIFAYFRANISLAISTFQVSWSHKPEGFKIYFWTGCRNADFQDKELPTPGLKNFVIREKKLLNFGMKSS
jgi:hypothetical protein